MASTDPSEEKELNLVAKLELRIALADTQDKLRALLATYLCPLLLKLASPHRSVKEKVISICQHINTRTRSNPLRLPVADLLQQFKKNTNSTVRHFDLLYIEQGLIQLTPAEKISLVPIILQGLSANFDDSPRNTAILFNLFLRLLQHYPLPSRGSQEDRAFRATWKLDENPQDAQFLAKWIGKLMQLQDSPALKSSPGLATEDLDFLRLYGKDTTWSIASGGLSLHDTKVQAVKMLWTAALSPSEKFIPSLLAAGSTVSRVSDIGEEVLKYNMDAVSLEERDIVDTLFSIYLGDEGNTGRLAANSLLKRRILRLLCRSRTAASSTESVIVLAKQELRLLDSAESKMTGPDRSLEASKLRKEVFSFVIWVARMAPKEALERIAPAVVGDLRAYIDNQGWPKIHDGPSMMIGQELVARQRGYESIGLFAQACPERLLLEPSLELLRWLLSSLIGDVSDKETSLSIESTLAIIMNSFGRYMSAELKEPLTALLLHYAALSIGDSDSSGIEVRRSPRFVAVRFANRCFPFDDLSARWIDLISVSVDKDQRQELVEEGTKGLDPYWFQILNPADNMNLSSAERESYMARYYRIPNPKDTIEYFFNSEDQRGQLGHAYVRALLFCRNSLFHTALTIDHLEPPINQDWERSLEVRAAQDEKGREAIAQFLDQMHKNSELAILQLVNRAFEGFVNDKIPDRLAAGSTLRMILSLGPTQIRETLSQGLKPLFDRTKSSNSPTRVEASQIFAMVISAQTIPTAMRHEYTHTLIETLRNWQKAVGSEVHQCCGAVLTISHVFCHMDSKPAAPMNLGEIQAETIRLMLSILFEGRDQDLLNATLVGLDQLFIYGVLTHDNIPSEWPFKKLIEKLYGIAKDGKEIAVACLGHIGIKSAAESFEESYSLELFEKLEALHEVRQPELHFSVGSALSCIAIGWSSKAMIQYRDIRWTQSKAESRTEVLDKILTKVLADCSQTKPSKRQAAAVWLLCILQDCSDQPSIQSRLRDIHSAFRNFLSDRNHLNQETASRGLALVYESGDKDIKDELIRDLVRSFTSNKSNLAGTVSEDTELFDAGALPTGDGSVTTYKDIVDLANEVGDPSLVYKFMSMASNSALWSSRAAFGRFGLSKVLADASESGYLAQNPKLYSTLYRYRFDPNSNVRDAMNEIWNSLVTNPQSVIEENFDRILDDLLKNVLGKEWRTRQACCAAISDLVQSKPLSRYEKQLTDIWNAAFKVCDDIKGSVRKAAMELVRALTSLLTRNLEHGDPSINDRLLKQVFPFLCGPQGLESSASDIRLFALSAIIDIVKKGERKTLQPYLGELVADHLLPSFTAVEPDVINYAYMKPTHFNITTEQIDNSRLTSVKLSPMMEAIEKCLDMLDDISMRDLTTRLVQSMKAIIGVPSKIGVSRVLVTLSTKHNLVFRPYADQFLKALRKQASDRNDTVSTSAAAACGYLSRVASDTAVLEHIQYCKSHYFGATEEKARSVSGDLTCAIVKQATDRSHSFATELFPFIFIGMHDIDEPTASEFKTAWEEMSGGSRTIRLYMREIAELALTHIESPQWAFKHTSSLAIADAVQLLGLNIADTDARILWQPLDKALSAKTWNGKEKVLSAFVHFIKNAELSRKDAEISARCQVIAFREAKRNNTGAYRQQAIKSLGEFIDARRGQDWYDQVSAVALPMIESLIDNGDAMDIDEGSSSDRRGKRLILEETLGNCVRTYLRSIDPASRHGANLKKSLEAASRTAGSVNQHGALVQNVLFEEERHLMQRLADATEAEIPEAVLQDFLATLDVKGDGVEATRLKSAEAVEAMAKLVKRGGRGTEQLLSIVEHWISVERSRSVLEVLERTKKALRL